VTLPLAVGVCRHAYAQKAHELADRSCPRRNIGENGSALLQTHQRDPAMLPTPNRLPLCPQCSGQVTPALLLNIDVVAHYCDEDNAGAEG
jgi:hypothetical protein